MCGRRMGAIVTAMAAVAACASVPSGAQLYNGWQYAIDSLNDGSGGAGYEMRGLAFRFVGNTAVFAVSSDMHLGGNVVSGVRNGTISLGDLFLNFSGNNLNTQAAFANSKVLAIRFDGTNDSLGNLAGSNTSTGVYKNITAASFTTQNHGYAGLQAYINAGFGRNPNAMADLESSTGDVTTYLSNGVMYPNMASGTFAGAITSLNRSTLQGTYGLDFSHFGADSAGVGMFGFSFDRSLLPTGDFTGHLFEECINDGVAIKGANVPEPSTMALVGLGTASIGLFGWRRRTAQTRK